jgi:hypothetical protein
MIIPVDDEHAEAAVGLLHRFFEEEGFAGNRTAITEDLGRNCDRRRADRRHRDADNDLMSNGQARRDRRSLCVARSTAAWHRARPRQGLPRLVQSARMLGGRSHDHGRSRGGTWVEPLLCRVRFRTVRTNDFGVAAMSATLH